VGRTIGASSVARSALGYHEDGAGSGVQQAQSDAAEQQARDGSASAGADDEDLRARAARKIDDLLRHGSAPNRVPRGGGLRVDASAPQVLEGSLQRSPDLLLVGFTAAPA
jgi:hypothetical protein